MDEFVARKNKMHFHGGESPDAVDFQLFSVLERVTRTNTLRILFRQRTDPAL